MTDTNLATLRELVGECRDVLENELCELIEELGPTLVEETRALASASRDQARRNACLQLQVGLQNDWIKLTPVFRDELTRRAEPVKSGEGLAGSPGRRGRGESADSQQRRNGRQLAMRDVVDRVQPPAVRKPTPWSVGYPFSSCATSCLTATTVPRGLGMRMP
jgi:hypothetical protein